MLKLHHLRDFAAIGRTSSIRSAAKALGLAQPAVSRSLKDTEDYLGVVLAKRHAQGIVLTPVGERFLDRANRILADLENAIDDARQYENLQSGSLHVGLSPALQGQLPMAILPVFRETWPGVSVRLTETYFQAAERALLDGGMDMYVGPKWASNVHAGISCSCIGQLQRAVFAHKKHPRRSCTSLGQLDDCDWLSAGLHEGASDELRTMFERERMPEPRVVATATSSAAIVSILLSTDCLAVLPLEMRSDWPLKASTNGLNALPIDAIPAISIWIAHRTALPLTPASQHFHDLVVESFKATFG